MQQKIVDFVGKHEQLDIDISFAQFLGEMNGFGEGNVAIVVTLYQENRRTPFCDRADRQRAFDSLSRELVSKTGLVSKIHKNRNHRLRKIDTDYFGAFIGVSSLNNHARHARRTLFLEMFVEER